MKKLVLLAGAGLLVLGSIDTAEAQRWHRGGGWRHGGGALAAGFIGGAVLGGLAAAATAPYYGYGYPYR